MTAYWVAVVSHEHVQRAVKGGFFQANHGKEAPVKRLAKGDRVIFYSPKERMKDGASLKSFTALGEVTDEEPHQVVQSADFKPFRRKVHYDRTHSAEIGPLLDRLSFSRGNKSWGIVLRRGFFEITAADYRLISHAMGAT